MFGITWIVAFVSEFASTRIGIPFGSYFYTASTVGQELYVANIPFMDSLSFTFLLFASYCLALFFVLPVETLHAGQPSVFQSEAVVSWPIVLLTASFFMLIDIVIDPVALRGDRWFLGLIYGYPEPGIYFGVPLANFAGWWIVGIVSMTAYKFSQPLPFVAREPMPPPAIPNMLFGCGLYYGVLLFNLAMTFWIEEWLLGLVGCFIYTPMTALALLRLPHWLQGSR